MATKGSTGRPNRVRFGESVWLHSNAFEEASSSFETWAFLLEIWVLGKHLGIQTGVQERLPGKLQNHVASCHCQMSVVEALCRAKTTV